MNPKPMLAVAVTDTAKINYPVVCSPKLDGTRCRIIDGKPISRSGKVIPNKAIQELFSSGEFDGFDGELIVGSPTAKDVFNRTTSQVMTINGTTDDLYYYVFDNTSNLMQVDLTDTAYKYRLTESKVRCGDLNLDWIRLIESVVVLNEKELLTYESKFLAQGYEGVIIRSPDAKYKHGRSTLKEGGMLKLKRFSDSEAVIIGYGEKYTNTNEAKLDELGFTKRSTAIAGMVGCDTLGELHVKDLYTGVEFSIGSGFDDITRSQLWTMDSDLIGRIVKYKYFSIGVVDKPRFPVWLSWRDEADLDAND